MIFQPRWYQTEAINAGIAFLQKPQPKGKAKRHGIIILPTGSGKSVVISGITKGLDAPALILQPSKEILEQNLSKLEAYGLNPSVCSASVGRKEVGDITLATIGSLVALRKNNPEVFARFRYVLMDECDLLNPKAGQYKDLFAALGDITILGLTATPYRLTSDNYGGAQLKFLTRTRPRVFNELVYYVQNSTLFNDGFLSKLEYHEVKGFDRNKLKANSTGAEYTDASIQAHFRSTKFNDKVVKVIERLIGGSLLEPKRKNALVFMPFLDDAEFVARNVPGAAIVTGETPKRERESILEGFKTGRIKVVINCKVLTVGFDFPALETVVLARPTLSLRMYYQMAGRALRPHPEKASAWIVDMCGMVEQFGKIEDMRIELEGNSKWIIASNGKPLTNTYLLTPDQWAAQKAVIDRVKERRMSAWA